MGKRFLSLLLAVLMALSVATVSAFAVETITEGDYSFVISDGKAKIVSCSSEENVLSVPSVLGSAKVTSVGENAFAAVPAKTINLPEGLISIEDNAFNDSSAPNIFIPDSCENIEGICSSAVIYGFDNSFVKTYASTNSISFVCVNEADNYKSYVGKKITLKTDASVSSTDSFCSVSSKTVTAKKKGTGVVTLKYSNGIKANVSFVISDAPQSISNLPSVINLYIGNTYDKFNPAISNGEYEGNFTYSVSDKSVATVDSKTGFITALKSGSVVITVSFDGLISATVPLNVGTKIQDFKLNKNELIIGVGEPAQLDAVKIDDNIYKKITYTSSNENVLTVSKKGVITSKKVGTAKITATLDTGKTDTCIVTVGKAPTSVTLAKSSINMGVGETVKYKASVNSGAICSTYLWRSSDTSIFTVDDNGYVYAKKVGSAKLSVYTYNYKSKTPNIKATAVINVKKAPSSVSFNKTNLVLGLGESFDLDSVLPKNTASYNRSVYMEDNTIATNGAGYVITALNLGATKFVLTTYNGKKAICNITVKPAPSSIYCKPTSVKLAIKGTYQLSPYVNSGSVCTKYNFKSDNTKVCTVDKNGLIKVKDYGSCWVYMSTYNSTTKHPIRCRVKVQVGYITNKVSSYTTYFDRYYYGKSTNLKLACKYINGKTDGYILQPGQTFSFNKAVGARTRARGFVDAKVVSGNGYVDGIGGGICQAATTIFNANLLGNLKIVERYPHNLKSSYVPLGRDATVSWGSQDYKFKNNFNTAIRIKMNYNSNGSINCSIYSLKKVNLPKISLKVTYSGGKYTLRRYAGGKVNYTAVSRYAN